MVDATQSYFKGPWQMVRIIEDVDSGVIGEVWGQSVFSEDAEGLICRENGVLRYDGTDFHTGRVSLWRFGAGGRIEVQYEDGRPFHDFLTKEPLALSIEGDARFEISYDFQRDGWLSTWEMSAPSTRYRMTTRYWR